MEDGGGRQLELDGMTPPSILHLKQHPLSDLDTCAAQWLAFAAKQAAEARAADSREFLARMSTLSNAMQQYEPERLPGYDGDWELGHWALLGAPSLPKSLESS